MYITTNYMPWTTSSRFDILVSSNSNTVYSTYTSNTSYFHLHERADVRTYLLTSDFFTNNISWLHS